LRRWVFAALPPAFSGLIASARGFSLGGKATEFDGTDSSIDGINGGSMKISFAVLQHGDAIML
jgi:hypothetical protein